MPVPVPVPVPETGVVMVRSALPAGTPAATGASARTRLKLSSKALCENAGGKYAQGTCQPGAAKSAKDMCVGFGGFLAVDEDLCHISPK